MRYEAAISECPEHFIESFRICLRHGVNVNRILQTPCFLSEFACQGISSVLVNPLENVKVDLCHYSIQVS